MYLFILLIVVLLYKKKESFKNNILANLQIIRDKNNKTINKKIELGKKYTNLQQMMIYYEKEKLRKDAEIRFKLRKDKISNEERQGILTSNSYLDI